MMKIITKNTEKNGFTLVELLIVVGILAIVTVLAVPVYSRAKNTALEAGAIKGLEAMYDAYQLYYRDHGFYPPARSTYSTEFYNHVRMYLPRDYNSATVTDGFVKGYEIRSLTRPFTGSSSQNGIITGSHYFTVMAIPLNAGRGLRTFFIEPNGIVTDGNTENPV